MSVMMGIIINRLGLKCREDIKVEGACCQNEESIIHEDKALNQKIKDVCIYAFYTLPKDMGFEILLGIALASLITVFEPIHVFIQNYVYGIFGYIFITFIGLLTYVCSTASIPLADALLKSGISQGQALCYLLVGPITSYGTILVIKKDFGWQVLTVYLGVICSLSIIFGIFMDIFLR